MIIDDHSNTEIIQSKYGPGRGELLTCLYFMNNKNFVKRAVIKYIDFGKKDTMRWYNELTTIYYSNTWRISKSTMWPD